MYRSKPEALPAEPDRLLRREEQVVGIARRVPTRDQDGPRARVEQDPRALLGILLVRERRELVEIRGHEGRARHELFDEGSPRPPLEKERPVARPEHRVDDAGSRERAEDPGYPPREVVGRQHADLDRVGRNVLDEGRELLRHDRGEGRVNPDDPPGRLDGERGGDGHAVHPVAREHLQVHLEPGTSRRVGARDGEGGSKRFGSAHRLRRVPYALLLVLLFVFARDVGAEPPVVVVLSWDGTHPDYLDRAETPALDRIRREGLEAERLVLVFPADTFPSHVSLATGTYPDRHGIVGNVFRDRERGMYRYSNDASWIEAEPVWVTAERQGVRAAVFFWVGSETDWHGIGATYRRVPFDSSVSESEKVEQILAWLDLPEGERPGLILSWWHGCDSVGHRWGPDHPRVADQLAAQDSALARLLDGLDRRGVWKYTTLLLVSDHGMAAVEEAVDLRGVLDGAGIRAQVIHGGGVAHVWLDREEDEDRALEILSALPGVSVYRGVDLPKELRLSPPSRTGDLVARTEPPRFFGRPKLTRRLLARALSLLGGRTGMHGYDPERPDMAAILLAMGRGVPAGRRLGPTRAIDVAPTITRLLGIDAPRDSEGHPIPEIGAPGSRSSEVSPSPPR